jgi:CCR4-NOT transcriptional regulation complex NOT5 subunit
MLEKILRAIDNDAIDLKPIHNLRSDIEYYVESNQESGFKENDMMYEEIDLDNLSNIMAPVIAASSTSHPSALANGASLNLTSISTIDMNVPLLNMHASVSHS